MYKRASNWSSIFKSIYIILFGFFFFTQLQPEFIEASYGYVYVKPAPAKNASCHNRTETESATKETFIKVSKRYEIHNPLIVFPSFIIHHIFCIVPKIESQFTAAIARNNHYLKFLLRGPPASSLFA